MRSRQTFSVCFLTALLTGPFLVGAEEMPPVRADLGYASQYVFRGIGRTGASAQAALELAGNDFRGGLWTNLPFSAGQERELNLNAAYAWQALAGLRLEVAAAQYWYGNVPAGGTRRSIEAGFTATLAPLGGITPSLEYAHDFRLRSETVQVVLAHSLALTGLGAYLDLGCFAGWATGDDWRPDAPGPRRPGSYGYWGAEAHLPYRLGRHSTLITGLHYTDSFRRSLTNGPSGLAGADNLWVTLGVSLDF
jgi:hypothetical protein